MGNFVVSIGSNINVDVNIDKALELLAKSFQILKVSDFLVTSPIGITDQPDFRNGAVLLCSDWCIKDVELYLKRIEDQVGRDRSRPKFGPREIDLDLVIWDGEVLDDDYYSRDFLKLVVDEVL